MYGSLVFFKILKLPIFIISSPSKIQLRLLPVQPVKHRHAATADHWNTNDVKQADCDVLNEGHHDSPSVRGVGDLRGQSIRSQSLLAPAGQMQPMGGGWGLGGVTVFS